MTARRTTVQSAAQTRKSFDDILEQMERTAHAAREIAAAAQQQQAASRQIVEVMHQVSGGVTGNAAASQQLAATADDIQREAENLTRGIGKFRTQLAQAPRPRDGPRRAPRQSTRSSPGLASRAAASCGVLVRVLRLVDCGLELGRVGVDLLLRDLLGLLHQALGASVEGRVSDEDDAGLTGLELGGEILDGPAVHDLDHVADARADRGASGRRDQRTAGR